jgi:hypothetical protein
MNDQAIREYTKVLVSREIISKINTPNPIEGRDYEFMNVTADTEKNVVMVEFIETYPDPKTGKVH